MVMLVKVIFTLKEHRLRTLAIPFRMWKESV